MLTNILIGIAYILIAIACRRVLIMMLAWKRLGLSKGIIDGIKLRFFVAKVQAELKAQYDDQQFVNRICLLPTAYKHQASSILQFYVSMPTTAKIV